MLVRLPHETDEELRTIHSMWEAGLVRNRKGELWGSVARSRGWHGLNRPLSDAFRSSAGNAYVELEE